MYGILAFGLIASCVATFPWESHGNNQHGSGASHQKPENGSTNYPHHPRNSSEHPKFHHFGEPFQGADHASRRPHEPRNTTGDFVGHPSRVPRQTFEEQASRRPHHRPHETTEDFTGRPSGAPFGDFFDKEGHASRRPHHEPHDTTGDFTGRPSGSPSGNFFRHGGHASRRPHHNPHHATGDFTRRHFSGVPQETTVAV